MLLNRYLVMTDLFSKNIEEKIKSLFKQALIEFHHEQLKISDDEKPPKHIDKRFYTINEVIFRLQLSRSTLQRYHNQGILKRHMFGKSVKYKEEDLLKFESGYKLGE